ncbi:MAG TPA: hypothetical protein VNO26_17010 [Candidatus Limnocylindria bacterium]|nr:hypothetical protein [Candidatus Limnocylindria bacterium]
MNRIGSWRSVLGVAALVVCLGAVRPAGAAPNTGRFSLSGGFDFTTAYFFRGILQERNGLIWQPYLTVSANLYSVDDYDLGRDGPVNSVSLFAGTWASLHSEHTGSTDNNTPVFYENDWLGGMNVGLFNKLTAGFSYVAYTSPSDAFRTVQEFDLNLALDDSEWLGTFALYPSAVVAYEFDKRALGEDNGAYLQLGIRPAFEVIKSERYPVTLAIPIVAGFSLNDYYETNGSNDETWGYTTFGLVGSIPLAFIPEDYGSWAFTMGATLYTFNHNLQEINDDDDPWVVGTAGISISY